MLPLFVCQDYCDLPVDCFVSNASRFSFINSCLSRVFIYSLLSFPLFRLPGCLSLVSLFDPLYPIIPVHCTDVSAQLVYYLLIFNVYFSNYILILFYLFCHLRPLCNLESSKTLQSKAKMPKKKNPKYLFIYFAAWVEIFTKTCRQENNLRSILSKNFIWLIPFFFHQLYLKYFIPTNLALQARGTQLFHLPLRKLRSHLTKSMHIIKSAGATYQPSVTFETLRR